MEYKQKKHLSVCLECGDRIGYGRTDKKFCCENCKNRHNNRIAQEGRIFRRKILGTLDRNYRILNQMLHSGITSADITDLVSSGFSPYVMTAHRIVRRRTECCCYDIKYIMTASRLSAISKIQNVSLPLPSDIGLSVKKK